MPISHKVFSHFQLWQTEVGNESLHYAHKSQVLLSQSELVRLTKTKSKTKKHEYLLSRFLLRHCLSQWFGCTLDYWEITENTNAAPSVTNLPRPIHFSLSHSNGRIQIAVSTYIIGIDIEKIKSRKNLLRMAEASFTYAELQAFSTCNKSQQLLFFYQLWCAKEAYYKTLNYAQQQMFVFTELDVMDKLNQSTFLQFSLHDEQFANCVVLVL